MVAVRRLGVATLALAVLLGMFLVIAARASDSGEGEGDTIEKGGFLLDISSQGRENAEDVIANGLPVFDVAPAAPSGNTVPGVQLRGGNIQINDPALDNIQTFTEFRPFVNYTQSETSAVAFEQNIVVGYNSSAAQTFTFPPLVRSGWTISGFSTSHDGGKTWTSGFIPPVAGSTFTFGDPSLGVDRAGNFYYATLGDDGHNHVTIQVNKSTDGGSSFAAPKIVQVDNGGDKEWLAVGPNPSDLTKDNIYVTWTSFQTGRSELRFGRSTDGGQTWTSKTIYAPGENADPTFPTSFLQFSNPSVDPANGALYVPFLHFSNADRDFIQVMVSYDGGDTFSFLNFNTAGTPDPTLLPLVQPGEPIDCGTNGGFRLTVHSGADQGGGRLGLARYRDASRLTVQPAFAARNGILYMAWSQSDSPFFGDPSSQSNIMFIRSSNGGQTWTTPIQVNPTSSNDVQHVLPSLTIDNDPQSVHVSYYTQHAGGGIDVDMANSHDRGTTFPANRVVRVSSVTTALPPTNTVVSGNNTTNYDRSIRPCYALGEYQSVESANGRLHVAWGDMRNTVQQPVNPLDPISGLLHQQTDVFYQQVKAP
jgi:hypothetical protein